MCGWSTGFFFAMVSRCSAEVSTDDPFNDSPSR
jgi:hypothetical protein